MSSKVNNLLEDWQTLNPALCEIANTLRTNIRQWVDNVDEEVKYGGILFAAPEPFCGIFLYKKHVSLEFSAGALINDPYGLLEGKGKGRRHLKFHTLADIEHKHVRDYVPLAISAAQSE